MSGRKARTVTIVNPEYDYRPTESADLEKSNRWGDTVKFDVVIPADYIQKALAKRAFSPAHKGETTVSDPALSGLEHITQEYTRIEQDLMYGITDTLNGKYFNAFASYKTHLDENKNLVFEVQIRPQIEGNVAEGQGATSTSMINHLIMLFDQADKKRHKMDVGDSDAHHDALVHATYFTGRERREVGTGLPGSIPELEEMLDKAVKRALKQQTELAVGAS